MAVDPISSSVASRLTSLPSLPSTGPAEPAAGSAGFGDMVTGAMESLDALHGSADSLAIQAATGDLTDVHEYTIAATQAELATQLTVAVRDKAVEAFTDIMRMQF